MDVPLNMTKVNTDPIMVTKHEYIHNVIWQDILQNNTSVVGIFDIPDDGYNYNITEGIFLPLYYKYCQALVGPCEVGMIISLTRNPYDWNIITCGYAYGYKSHIPTRQTAISLKFPNAVGMYLYNKSNSDIYYTMGIIMYTTRKKGI